MCIAGASYSLRVWQGVRGGRVVRWGLVALVGTAYLGARVIAGESLAGSPLPACRFRVWRRGCARAIPGMALGIRTVATSAPLLGAYPSRRPTTGKDVILGPEFTT